MSGGVEWALHCCVVLTSVDAPAPAARLAQLHDVSPSYLAKQLQALSRAEIIRSVQGNAGGYVLTRPPSEITLLDIVEAIDGPDPAFRCTEIRQRGPMATPPEACTVPCPISRAMANAEAQWREALRAVSIADLADNVRADSGPDALASVGGWFKTAEG